MKKPNMAGWNNTDRIKLVSSAAISPPQFVCSADHPGPAGQKDQVPRTPMAFPNESVIVEHGIVENRIYFGG